MAGVELGVGYISVLPSAKGMGRKIQSELAAVNGDAAGRSVGEKFKAGAMPSVTKLGAAVAGAFILKKGLDLGKLGIGIASQMEQAKISFTTMLGSGEKAQKFLDDLADFAAKTPFEFPELQTAASSLVSAGVNAKDVVPIMKSLGDATAGMGTGQEGIKRATVALQQMNAAQKISAEDLNQLRDAGIPVYDLLAKAMGKSKAEVAALASEGGLGKDALDKMMGALKSGKGLERFNGLMDKQSQSLAGVASTLKDTFGMGLAKALAPSLPLLKQASLWLAARLEPAMQKLGAGIAAVIPYIGLFVTRMRSMFSWVSRNRVILTQIAIAVGAAVVVFKTISIVTRAWAVAQGILNTVMSMNPLVRVALLVGVLVGALVLAYQRSEKFRTVVTAVWNGIKTTINAVWGWLSGTLWPGIKSVFGWIGDTAKTVGSVVGTAWGGIKKSILAVWTWVSTVFKGYWAGYKAIVLNPIKTAVVWIARIWWGVTKGILSVWTWLGTTFAKIWNGAKDLLTKPIGWAITWIARAWNGIKKPFMDVYNWIKGKLDAAKNLMKEMTSLEPKSRKGQAAKGLLNPFAPIPGKAAGGPVSRTGPYWVGERGPEIVHLNRGNYVQPNHALGGQPVTINNHTLDNSHLARKIVQQLAFVGGV